MMSLFAFDDYKSFVTQSIESRPNRGRGELSKLARALGVHPTMVTHIFKGDYHLSTEQALALSEHMGLSELETEYLISLVNFARAGDERSRQYFKRKSRKLKEASLNLRTRHRLKNKLRAQDQEQYYSSWIYSAIRLLTAIPGFAYPGVLATRLNLPPKKVSEVLEFLSSRGLVKKEGDRYTYAQLETYLDRDSPYATRHSLNWRLKALERLESVKPVEIAFSYPVVLAEDDVAKASELILKFIEEFRKFSRPSASETLFCLNIDWLKIIS